MSEQPTYWRHKGTGDIWRVNTEDIYNYVSMVRLEDGATDSCPRKYFDLYEPIPTPQVGEKWTNGDHSLIVHAGTLNGLDLDRFMQNYRKVEDVPNEENTAMFEPRYYRHNTTGAIEKVITQERAFALENNTDWKRFYYTFHKEDVSVKEWFDFPPRSEVVLPPPSFTDKLKEEIHLITLNILEHEEEIERLQVDTEEMKAKRLEWQDMLDHHTEFTDKYPDTLL